MAVTNRALHAVWNVGIECVTPLSNNQTARGLHAVWNVGIETVDPLVRALHAVWNVGIEQVNVLYRALYAYWNVEMVLDSLTNLEWVLYDTDLETIEHILRGK